MGNMEAIVSGPYQVDWDLIERLGTLDATDIESWYVLINGSIQFVDSENHGRFVIEMLTKCGADKV